jgi:hypothetical protein
MTAEFDWKSLPNYPWAGCLASNLRRPAVDWHACVEAAHAEVDERIARHEHEWRVMARDPIWRHYGGQDTPEGRADYIRRNMEIWRSAILGMWCGTTTHPLTRALLAQIDRRYPIATCTQPAIGRTTGT